MATRFGFVCVFFLLLGASAFAQRASNFHGVTIAAKEWDDFATSGYCPGTMKRVANVANCGCAGGGMQMTADAANCGKRAPQGPGRGRGMRRFQQLPGNEHVS